MFTEIRKRDGRVVPFDAEKITEAVGRAGAASGEFDRGTAHTLCVRVLNVAQQVLGERVPTVEEIQDIVENVLIQSPFTRTAKRYIIYRDQHARIREIVSKAGTDLIDSYIQRMDWQVKENSNMAFSLQGLNNYISAETSRVYWLNKVYPPDIRDAHLHGDFHVHDLSILSVYCVGWDLQDLLRCGFRGARGKIESGPANHLRSALGQVVNFFYTLQGEAAGAQAFSSLDTLLAPFIRYDRLDHKGVKQALQEFVFNINVPTRVGFQTPFTNVTLDLRVPSTLKDQPVIRGGTPTGDCYGDFQEEMDMFNRAFLEIMLEGDASGRVFTFPVPTYNVGPDFPWDNPNLDLLWQVTGKYGIPYFANFVNSDMSPEDARSMCCRLRLDLRSLSKRGGGLFGANPLTGSIGVVTINMPRLGYLAESREDFYARLAHLMDLAKESLEIKRKILEKYTDAGLYPYSKFYLRNVFEHADEYWHNHFSIGIIGMNEACRNLLGMDIGQADGRQFAREVLDFMRERLLTFQDETGNNYNLEATPGEGTSYRLAKIDRKRYPKIETAPTRDGRGVPYYTNSTQLPVNYTDDLFEALDIQDDLQARYTGGTVFHSFIGERIEEAESVKQLVRRILTQYRLPYLTLTPTFSICPQHGYRTGEQPQCSECGSECEVYSRIVGYLRPVDQWNEGKREEYENRTTYRTAEAHNHAYRRAS